MPKNHPDLTAARLRELLSYDPDTGIFRRAMPGYSVKVGAIAGSPDGQGYLRISVNTKRFKAHRLAWLYVYGRWPTDQIDHINGLRDDNRIANLREATSAENHQNRTPRLGTKSGNIGVTWSKTNRKWQAKITANGIESHIGCFDTLEEAISARAKAKAELHKFQPFDRTLSALEYPLRITK